MDEKEKENKDSSCCDTKREDCPHCGRCPKCGRKTPDGYYPWYPNYPWQPWVMPYPYWNGTTWVSDSDGDCKITVS